MAIKISTCMQVLLQLENLDPQIITNLDLNPIVDIAPIDVSNGTHDLINNLLQANCMSIDLEILQQKAID
jgi:hypothetical protein